MLEGTLRGGIRPGTLTAECFHATLGGAEHRVFDLATGIGDEQVKLGSGGNVEHDSVRLYVATVQGQRSGVKHVAVRPLPIRQARVKQAEHVTAADAGVGTVAATPPSNGNRAGQWVERDLPGGVTDSGGVDREHGSVRLYVAIVPWEGVRPRAPDQRFDSESERSEHPLPRCRHRRRPVGQQ